MAELTAQLGVDTDGWSLREIVWGLEAKREAEWADRAYALSWILNRIPSFSKGRRAIHPDQINPFRRARRGIPLRGDAGEAALDAMSVAETPQPT